MANEPIGDPETDAAVIDPPGQGTGGGNSPTSDSSDEVTAFAASDDAVIDPPAQGTGGGNTTDAAIDPGGQGTGGGQ